MPTKTKTRRKDAEPKRADAKETRQQRDKGWNDRLRLVGDARFTDVKWSGRDNPSWPLPAK